MKSNKQFRSLAAMFLVCVFIFTACKKKETYDYDAADSHSTSDNIFKDINKVINDGAADGGVSGKNESTLDNTCATVNVTPSGNFVFPKTVTVDFGLLGCTDQYGVHRRGKVTGVFSDYLHNPGAHVAVTFQDYYVNGNKVEGLYNLANTSVNTTSRSFKDTITNGKITRSTDGKTITWNATRYSDQTQGFASTADLSDDEYTGGGQSDGIGFNGKSFSATSTNVVWRLACKYLVSGLVTIYSGTDPKPVKVDFGNGTCDNVYTVSYDIYHADLNFWY